MNPKFNILPLLTVLLTVILLLAACGEQSASEEAVPPTDAPNASIEETTPNEADTTTEEAENETADTPAEGFPRTITDGQGRELTFERPPERVLPYYNGSFGHLATLGIRPIATGANPEMLSDPIYLPDGESISRPMVDGTLWDIDLEKVASYEPDLIMAFNVDEVNSSGAIAPVYLPSDAETLEDVFNELRNVASIFGVDEKAEEVISAFNNRVDTYAKLNESNAEMTIMKLAILDDGQFSVSTTSDPVCQMLDIVATCAWENPIGEEGWGYDTSIEGILALDPDIIILNSWVGDDVDGSRKAVQDNPLYAELSAVKSGMVFSTPGYENPIASNLPAAQKVLDTYMPRFFPDIFDGPLTEEQVQEILSSEGANSSTEGFPRTIVDGAGREITFDKPPERIVALWNGNFGQLAALGVYPVATNASEDWLSDATYYLPEAETLPSVEAADGSIDLELVASFEPDLVLGLTEEEAQQLEGIAPVFVNAGLNFQNVDAYKENLRVLGRIFDIDQTAETVITDFENRLAAYQHMVENETEPTALIFRSWGDQSFYAYTVATAACLLLDEVANCEWENPAGGIDVYQTSYEGALSLDPDVILLGHNSNFTEEDIENLFTELEENPLWNELSAVKNDRVVYVEGYENQSVNNLASAVKFLDVIVPRIYPNIFDGPLTDEQVQEILAQQ